MKLIRILISVLFVVAVGAWSVNIILSKTVRDHTPPVITSDREVLELSVNDDSSKLLTGLTATDDKVGTYYVTFEASNSYADVVNRKLPVNIVNDTVDSPKIELSDYLIYVNIGDKFNPAQYLKAVSDKFDKKIDLKKVSITSTVDTKAAGVHQVRYEYTDSKGLTGHSFLIVIVREG